MHQDLNFTGVACLWKDRWWSMYITARVELYLILLLAFFMGILSWILWLRTTQMISLLISKVRVMSTGTLQRYLLVFWQKKKREYLSLLKWNALYTYLTTGQCILQSSKFVKPNYIYARVCSKSEWLGKNHGYQAHHGGKMFLVLTLGLGRPNLLYPSLCSLVSKVRPYFLWDWHQITPSSLETKTFSCFPLGETKASISGQIRHEVLFSSVEASDVGTSTNITNPQSHAPKS